MDTFEVVVLFFLIATFSVIAAQTYLAIAQSDDIKTKDSDLFFRPGLQLKQDKSTIKKNQVVHTSDEKFLRDKKWTERHRE